MAVVAPVSDIVKGHTVVRYLSMTQRPFHMGVLCDDFTASVCRASADMLASSPLIEARIAASLSAFSWELRDHICRLSAQAADEKARCVYAQSEALSGSHSRPPVSTSSADM